MLTITALVIIAALYFTLSCGVTLEWIDEGQLVYQSWLTAQGAIPHREFQHVYGPGLYLLNAALFRVFGSDLLVIRLSLVLLKAIVSVLVYLVSLRVVSRPFALIAFLSTVVVWGGPWWVFNTPYASHYALALVLSGVWLFLRQIESDPGGSKTIGALLAGLCCGLAATFKQTTGLFALLSVVVFLVWDATAHAAPPSAGSSRAAQALRILALAGAVVVCVGYLAANNTVWNVAVLLGPLLIGITWVGLRELRNGAGTGSANVGAMIAGGAGMVIPLLLCVAAYVVVGALNNLIFSTISGLPQSIKWFFPVAAPDLRSAVIGVAAGLLAAGCYQLGRNGFLAVPCLAIGAAITAAAMFTIIQTPGVPAYIAQDAWIGDVFRLVFLLPFVAILAAFLALIREGVVSRVMSHPRTPAVLLCALIAASGLLALYPAADFWHLVMVWPFFAPLLAWTLERVVHRSDGRREAVALGIATMLLLYCAAPFVHALARARNNRPADVTPFARASHVTDGSQKVSDAAAAVRFLDTLSTDRTMLSFGEGQMLYYLAGRHSLLGPEEFIFYLVGTGFIADADARRMAPEADMIARIKREQPVIVTVDGSPFTTRLRSVFTELTGYIDAHYQTAVTFGAYRVLERAARE